MPKTLAVLVALLAAIAIPATQARAAKGGAKLPSAPKSSAAQNLAKKTSKSNKDDTPIATNEDEKWFLEFTPGYMKPGGADVDQFTGASVAIGYQLTKEDKFQLELGYYRSNNVSDTVNYTRNLTYIGIPTSGTGDLKMTGTKRTGAISAIPVLLSYSYCIPLWADRLEFRLTPVAGTFIMNNKSWSVDAKNTEGGFSVPGVTITSVTATDGTTPPLVLAPDGSNVTLAETFHGGGSSSNLVFACGGGFGISYNLTPRMYLELGYRYLWTAKVRNDPAPIVHWNGVAAWNGMNTHNYSATLGWRF